jgi:hypothetical protein
MRKKLLTWAAVLLGVFVVYLAAGIVVSSIILPGPSIDHANYFRVGDRLVSRVEGFDQTVLGVYDGWLHTRLEIAPHAGGPPEHFHEGFAESFTVKSGTLSVLVNGEKRTIRVGETVTVPPMTTHKPFNETDYPVVIESDDPRSVPAQFGYILSQLYGFMDNNAPAPSTLQMMMQLAVYGEDADTWIANGPPVAVQKVLRIVMAPTARLLGYRYHYDEYTPSH